MPHPLGAWPAAPSAACAVSAARCAAPRCLTGLLVPRPACAAQVELVHDPVTRLPTGRAVAWMECASRAADLVNNLNDMVFLLAGTPRPLRAARATPGPAAGLQSVYDRALRAVVGTDDTALQGAPAGSCSFASACLLALRMHARPAPLGHAALDASRRHTPCPSRCAGGTVDFLEVPDSQIRDPGAPPEHRATVLVRRLLQQQEQEHDNLRRVTHEGFKDLAGALRAGLPATQPTLPAGLPGRHCHA